MSESEKPPFAFRVFIWLYVAGFAVDTYFQFVNGTVEWACLDFSDGRPAICLGMGDWSSE